MKLNVKLGSSGLATVYRAHREKADARSRWLRINNAESRPTTNGRRQGCLVLAPREQCAPWYGAQIASTELSPAPGLNVVVLRSGEEAEGGLDAQTPIMCGMAGRMRRSDDPGSYCFTRSTAAPCSH
jgi:hypothetical protein